MTDQCSQTEKISRSASISFVSRTTNFEKEQILSNQFESSQNGEMLTSVTEEVLLCTVCNNMFQTQGQLDGHLQEYHGAPGVLSNEAGIDATGVEDDTIDNDPEQIYSNTSQSSFNPISKSTL